MTIRAAFRAVTCSAAFLTPLASWAEDLTCRGVLPSWEIRVKGQTAGLSLDRELELDVMLTTPAEGRDWPIALTLVGGFDTAILLVENEACQVNDYAYPYQAQVLTQIGEVPVLLTGCCQPAE